MNINPTHHYDTNWPINVSVVVPVYNSAETLSMLVSRLTEVLHKATDYYEIVLVDDGSHDDSWVTMQAQHDADPTHVVAVQLMRNYGQHNALMCGLNTARGDVIITLDDDLQNPPEEIPKLIAKLEKYQLDLVYGVPQDRKHAGWRNVGALLVQAFYRVVFRTNNTPTSFRAMRAQVAQSIGTYNLNYTYIDGLLAWCTDRISTVDVAHEARHSGHSGYSIRKLMFLALNLFTNFSLLPLQVVTVMGLIAAVSGFSVGGYYLFQYLHSNITVPGFASTIITILILGGAQMLALGIIGEYLGRLHLNVNKKPQYVVRNLLHSCDRSHNDVTESQATSAEERGV
mgnify:CR=1 FL=1